MSVKLVLRVEWNETVRTPRNFRTSARKFWLNGLRPIYLLIFDLGLCLLLWLGFSKTMKLLLPVRRDLSVRSREITLALNRVQSADFR